MLALAVAGGMLAGGGVSIGSIVFILGLVGVVALGLRFVFQPSDFVEVDLDARTYVHIRDHTRRDRRPLDDLAPLVVSERRRTVRTKNGTRTVTEYAVHPEGRADLDFRVVKDRGEARLILEALARRWQLPSVAWGGELRQAGELDLPLYERLRRAGGAVGGAGIRPEWNLRVEPLSPGYAIVSTHRDYRQLIPYAILLVPAGFAALIFTRSGFLREFLGGGERDPVSLLLGAGLLVLLLGLLVRVAAAVRDTFLPGTIRVTPEGVSYRGWSMPFEAIEEVIGAVSIEFVGDRRVLRVAPTFCPPEAVPALCEELERMIVELAGAPRSG